MMSSYGLTKSNHSKKTCYLVSSFILFVSMIEPSCCFIGNIPLRNLQHVRMLQDALSEKTVRFPVQRPSADFFELFRLRNKSRPPFHNVEGNEKSASSHIRKTFEKLAVVSLAFLLFSQLPIMQEVIANPVSPVLDEARSLGSAQREKLAADLSAFEGRTGWKIRILTRDSRRQEERISPQALRELWNLPDEKAVVVILDASKSNILGFNSGAAVSKLLPQSFFSELTGRLGNIYEVRKLGESGVVVQSVSLLEQCLERKQGCRYVPGISDDQYTATLGGSLAGGAVFGFSALTARQFIEKKAKGMDGVFKVAPLLYAPLWGTFFFGLGAFAAAAAATMVLWPVLMRFDPPSIRF